MYSSLLAPQQAWMRKHRKETKCSIAVETEQDDLKRKVKEVTGKWIQRWGTACYSFKQLWVWMDK